MKHTSVLLLLLTFQVRLISQTVDRDIYIGMHFVYVKSGTFKMGATSEQLDTSVNHSSPRSDETAHDVTLTKDYYMATTEVTQAQWEKVMGSNPSYANYCKECPVEYVSWDNVQEFLKKVNAELLKKNPNEKRRYRLPTEAEWEYAARGGHKARVTSGAGATRYAGGHYKEYLPTDKIILRIGDVAWYSSNSSGKTQPVGQKKPNELGLYDMSGNVWEWCSDWYSASYYKSSSTASNSYTVTDPKGPSDGSYRVARGGGWYHDPIWCRVAFRGYAIPGSRNNSVGFRLCLSL